MMKRVMSTLFISILLASTSGLATEIEQVDLAANESDQITLRRLVDRISLEYGINRFLIHAMVRVESDYNPRVISRRGAMGLMQLMPDTARYFSVSDPFDPEQNVRAGVQYISRLLDRYAGDLPLALAAYNAGPNAVDRYNGIPPYHETRRYVVKIMSLYTGKPFRLPELNLQAPQVRMLQDTRTGEVLITNDNDSAKGHQQVPRGVLGGGFLGSTQ